jgi:glutathione S-transferase
MSLKLYGVPLSPPFRAVAWTLLQKQVPFEIKVTIPGATSKMGTLHESYLQKTGGRCARVPLLEDGSLCVAESPAILTFLCESRSWSNLYAPPASTEKTLVDSYMHWHHEGTRNIALLTKPRLRPELKLEVSAKEKENVQSVLETLDSAWLKENDFLGGTEQHSIADILAYQEVAQAYMTDALDLKEYSNIEKWVKRMQQVPYHDAAHAALPALGSLTAPNETPMMKRLGHATKEGMKAINEAQESY